MSDRLNEAIDKYVEQSDPSSPWHIPDWVHDLADAARAYADLVNGERVEPDYEAAARAMFDADDAYEQYEWSAGVGAWYRRMASVAVAAAIGDRLLIDPPKEEE